MKIRRTLTALAGLAAAALTLTGSITGAAAAVSPNVTYTATQAGFTGLQGGYRFRYNYACTYLRAADQSSSVSIGLGLANPSDGGSVHVGVAWNGTTYTPAVAINGETGTPFAADLVISKYDTICQSVYYNPATGWVTFTVADATTGVQRTYADHYGWAAWYSAQYGVQDTRTLTGPATGVLVIFRGIYKTTYSGIHGGLLAPGNTQAVAATQDGLAPGTGNVIMIAPGVPSASSFPVYEGTAAAS